METFKSKRTWGIIALVVVVVYEALGPVFGYSPDTSLTTWAKGLALTLAGVGSAHAALQGRR